MATWKLTVVNFHFPLCLPFSERICLLFILLSENETFGYITDFHVTIFSELGIGEEGGGGGNGEN